MIKPSVEELYQFVSDFDYVPIYQETSAALETPLAVFMKLREAPYAYLLESVDRGEQVGRYSFVGFNPSIIFQAQDGLIKLEVSDQKIEYFCSDPLLELEKIFQKRKTPRLSGLPPFSGGAVGYFGYEMVRYCDDLPKSLNKKGEFPDCLFMFSDTLLIFDHVKQTIKIVANIHTDGDLEENYLEGVRKIEEISMKLENSLPKDSYKNHAEDENLASILTENYSQEEFMEMVSSAKKNIFAGDIFQVVLSKKTHFRLKKDPIMVYRRLRSMNPSPYMFFLSFGDIKLIGSSPEVMVKTEDDKVELRPIAGTRPRGKTEAEDQILAKSLLADEKELAEHLMLVDLGRNDVGRVSDYGTVHVKDFMHVENYSHVMHIVSNVHGKIKKDLSSFDVFRAAFPAGTVSGAPKIRAIEIIEELEKDKRGPYAGAVGWISYSGNMDTCIAIRTLFIKGNEGFIQAGAGIVADSDPLYEYKESSNKAKALLKALGVEGVEEKHAVGDR